MGATDEDQLLTRGRLVYRGHCARCHGGDGRGGGLDATTLRPPPRDLASPSRHSAGARGALRRVVAEGIPGTSMPGTAGVLSSGELEAVVDYVWSLEITAVVARGGFTAETIRAAPPLSFRGADGTIDSLNRLRGKVVLVAFWGTTCIPCMEELPELERLADRFRRTDLLVLPVCLDEADSKTAHEIAASRVLHLPVYVDSGGTARQRYDVRRLPQAVMVDREGRVVARLPGAGRWLGKEIEELLCAVLGVPFPVGPDEDHAAR